MSFALVEKFKVLAVFGGEPGIPGARPVVRNIPAHDRELQYVRQKPFTEWDVYPDRVEVTFDVKDYDLDKLRASLLRSVSETRKRVEFSGTKIGPEGSQKTLRTDESTQGKIAGAKAFLDNNPAETIDFRLASGEWLAIDAAQIQMIADAVGSHVQATFSRAKQLEDQIYAATTVPELWAVDLYSGWPVN